MILQRSALKIVQTKKRSSELGVFSYCPIYSWSQQAGSMKFCSAKPNVQWTFDWSIREAAWERRRIVPLRFTSFHLTPAKRKPSNFVAKVFPFVSKLKWTSLWSKWKNHTHRVWFSFWCDRSRIRTCDRLLRRQMLYPAELCDRFSRAQIYNLRIF